MQRYFAIATVILLVILVVSRIILMNKVGIKAVRFGEMDKTDFFIPPFALLFFYVVLASTLNWPILGEDLFHIFAISRNPIYTAFGLVLLGYF